jgi:putative peptide zinc metalloprotease protein
MSSTTPRAANHPRPTAAPGRAGAAEPPPRLAPGLELIGEFEGSGLKEAPLIARRADGQVVQLHQILYVVAEQIDGRRTVAEIAARVSERVQRELAPDDLQYLIDQKLRPLGVVDSPGDETRPATGLDPLLALKLKTAVVPERLVHAITTVFRPLFLPPVIVLVLASLAALDYWLFVDHGIAQSVRQILLDPLLMLMVLGLVVLSAAFHESGHATATRYGGARPGVMGVGIYIVWPAFYTDITDSYRLGRAGRLRADLGGVYFNVIFILATAAAYLATGFEPLLIMIPLQHVEIVHQFLPFLRLDGYYIISDLTGVPDMFARVKPIMASLVPGRPTEPRVTELKTWARATVTVWVLILVPVLIFMFGLMALTAPRIFATAWTSLGSQWETARHGLHNGSYGSLVLAAVQAVALVLPAAGLVATFWRLGVRIATTYWTRTAKRPATRTAGLLTTAVVVAVVAWAWWPRQQYTPIQPNERGTLASAMHTVRHVTSPDPTGGTSAHHHAGQPRPASANANANGAGVPTTGGPTSGEATGASTGSGGEAPTSGSTSGDGTGASTGSGGGTTDDGSQAPPPATDLSADASSPGELGLSWALPSDADVEQTVVRRGDGSDCPATATSGTQIGGTTARSSQTDTTVANATTYCYAVFLIDSQGRSSAPATVTAQTPTGSDGGGGSTGQ